MTIWRRVKYEMLPLLVVLAWYESTQELISFVEMILFLPFYLHSLFHQKLILWQGNQSWS